MYVNLVNVHIIRRSISNNQVLHQVGYVDRRKSSLPLYIPLLSDCGCNDLKLNIVNSRDAWEHNRKTVRKLDFTFRISIILIIIWKHFDQIYRHGYKEENCHHRGRVQWTDCNKILS